MVLNRIASTIAASALVGISFTAPLEAQATTFSPNLGLLYIYRSNVNFVGDTGQSDSSLRLRVALPVDRTLKKGSLNFTYLLYGEVFDQFSNLDHVGHRLSFSLNTKPTQRSTLDFRIGYARGQDQGGPLLAQDEVNNDPTFTRRINREQGNASLGYRYQLTRKWQGGVRVRVSSYFYEDVEDFGPGDEGLEDRTVGTLQLDISRQVTRFTRMGLAVTTRRFDLDLTGITDSLAASFVVDQVIGQRTDWRLALGGYRNTADDPVVEEEVSVTGFQGSFVLNRALRRVDLQFLARHRPNVGGARLGTSVNTDIRLGVVDTYFRRWTWSLYARYARRDPDEVFESTIDAGEMGGAVQVSLARVLGLVIGASYGDQTSDSPSQGSFYRVAASMVWYPLGWKKWSRGEIF